MIKETTQPFFRVTTFGRFSLERLVCDPEASEPRYEVLAEGSCLWGEEWVVKIK